MVLVFNAKKRLTLSAGVAGALAALLDGCSSTPIAPGPQTGAPPRPPAPASPAPAAPFDMHMPPPAPREFRAAWVSTVANIDWPSRNNLTMAKQQAEALAILDRAQSLNLNAIVLQVRPSADAIYPSELEPWSEFLTGQQGRAPATAWDPLQFWIEQAHARGLELHAWFNPYRARHATARSPLARNHIGSTHPRWSSSTAATCGWTRAKPWPRSTRWTWCWTWCAATISTASTSTTISIHIRSTAPPARPARKAWRWTPASARSRSWSSRTKPRGSSICWAAARWTAPAGVARTSTR